MLKIWKITTHRACIILVSYAFKPATALQAPGSGQRDRQATAPLCNASRNRPKVTSHGRAVLQCYSLYLTRNWLRVFQIWTSTISRYTRVGGKW
ncbi:MAG: hypothetical protein CSA32_00745 [Desulfobulbus propionicus]|nr:MAG: hypothetical protein CSA32_00745 [Desulfobulbus propionicus]